MSKLNYSIKRFDELNVKEFHDLVKLRVDIFVVEQECAYDELDGKDESAIHILGKDNQAVLHAYARIISKKGDWYIGRIVVAQTMRNQGIGQEIMNHCLDYLEQEYGTRKSKLSAQSHLQKFYERFGYTAISKEYDWDGIPHVDMILEG